MSVRGTGIPGTRVFYRPSLGKVIFRPIDVIRSSKKVQAINKKLEDLAGTANHPVTKCKGQSWKPFVACLKKEMKLAVKPV